MADGDFFDFLARCLEAIERDAGRAYHALCERLHAHIVHLRVDGKVGSLYVSSHRLVIERFGPTRLGIVQESDGGALADLRSPARGRASTRHALELVTTRATIAELVDGERTLFDALLDDSLLLRGTTDAIIVAYDALMLFLKGAVRSPVAPQLLDLYLGRQALTVASVSNQEAS
jgi:hypothetical protein